MLSQMQYGRRVPAKILRAVVILMAVFVFARIYLGLFTSVDMLSEPRGGYRRAHLRIQHDVAIISTSLNQFKSITGHYPTTEQGLAALVTQRIEGTSSKGERTLLSSMPKDPWGHEYVYVCPGRVHLDSYDLYSPGPDGIAGTSDDDAGN